MSYRDRGCQASPADRGMSRNQSYPPLKKIWATTLFSPDGTHLVCTREISVIPTPSVPQKAGAVIDRPTPPKGRVGANLLRIPALLHKPIQRCYLDPEQPPIPGEADSPELPALDPAPHGPVGHSEVFSSLAKGQEAGANGGTSTALPMLSPLRIASIHRTLLKHFALPLPRFRPLSPRLARPWLERPPQPPRWATELLVGPGRGSSTAAIFEHPNCLHCVISMLPSDNWPARFVT